MASEVAQLMAQEVTKRAKMRVVVEKLMTIYETKLRVMEAYKPLKPFKMEIATAQPRPSQWASTSIRFRWLNSFLKSI